MARVADHRQLQELGYPEAEAKRLARKHNEKITRKFLKKRLAGATPESARILADGLRRAGSAITLDQIAPTAAGNAENVDQVITLAQYAPAGVQFAGTVDWDSPATGAGRQPRASRSQARRCTP